MEILIADLRVKVGEVWFVCIADFHPPKMLRNGRMADLVKLHGGGWPGAKRQLWAAYQRGTRIPNVKNPHMRGVVGVIVKI